MLSNDQYCDDRIANEVAIFHDYLLKKCNGDGEIKRSAASANTLYENGGADKDTIITFKEFHKLTGERSAILDVLEDNLNGTFK
jgi:hypothetical protein